MPKLSPSRTLAVSRFLSSVARYAENPGAVEALARHIWMLPKFYLGGRKASLEESRVFLGTFKPYLLLGPAWDTLTTFLDGLTEEQTKMRDTSASATHVEYRASAPQLFQPVTYYARRGRRKWPTDDWSERICEAYDALTAAKCKRPVAFIAEALESRNDLPPAYCTIQHVHARLKAFRDRIPEVQQEVPVWLHSYWLTLDPKNRTLNANDRKWPERFEFELCDC
jgi:hypothetical protein